MRLGSSSWFLRSALLLSGFSGVLAKDPEWIYESCSAGVDTYLVDCGDLAYYTCRCTSSIYISSILKCAHTISKDDNAIAASFNQFIPYCSEYGDVEVTYAEMEAIYEASVRANNFTSTADINATLPLTSPIILQAEELELSVKTVKTFYWERYSGTLFG